MAERMAEIGPRAPARPHAATAPRVLRRTAAAHHRPAGRRGQPWASLLAGPAGFVSSPTPQRLRIRAQALPADPAAVLWREGAPVALLGLQAHTGRRNRMNGRIVRAGAEGFEVRWPRVSATARVHPPAPGPAYAGDGRSASSERRWLDAASRALVGAADTFFIASTHPAAARARRPSAGVGVSHRGRPAGFVRVQPDGAALPRLHGQFLLQHAGQPAAGAALRVPFVDFATGERLHLAGRAVVLPGAAGSAAVARRPAPAAESKCGARCVAGGLPLRWQEA